MGAAAVLALGILVAGLSSYGLLQRSLREDIDAALRDRASTVQRQIETSPIGQLLAPTGTETGKVQVFSADGRLLAATPGMTDRVRLAVIAPAPLGRERIETAVDARIDADQLEHYRILTRSVNTRLGVVRMFVASSLDGERRVERRFRDGFLIAGPFLVGASGLLAAWVVGRALAPVESMRAEVDRIEASNLSVRLAGTERKDELSRLGVTLNHLLDRIDESAASQRRFAAAASHELRSPATAIRTELEVALAYPERTDWTSVATDCVDELARLETIIADLRTLTTNRAAPIRRSELDLGELVQTEIARRPPVRSVRYQLETQPALVSGDADSLLQMIRNLCSNAERHAHREIRVGVTMTATHVVLRVINDGEPIRASDREHIFEPFTRLDEARSKDSGGSGLGLAIARSLCLAHGGSLTALDTSDGACFEVLLPRFAGSAT